MFDITKKCNFRSKNSGKRFSKSTYFTKWVSCIMLLNGRLFVGHIVSLWKGNYENGIKLREINDLFNVWHKGADFVYVSSLLFRMKWVSINLGESFLIWEIRTNINKGHGQYAFVWQFAIVLITKRNIL